MTKRADTDGATDQVEKPKARRRGRPPTPPDVLRRRLIDAAERCFERASYADVGVMDIVHEARMSSRSFYRFFKGKPEIAIELARQRADVYLEELEEIARTAEHGVEVVDRALRTFLEQLPVVVLELEHVGGSTAEEVRRVRDVYRERIAALLLREISKRVQEGVITEMPDPMSLILVLGGVENLIIRYTSERRRDELVAMHPQIMAALEKLLPDLIHTGDIRLGDDDQGET